MCVSDLPSLHVFGTVGGRPGENISTLCGRPQAQEVGGDSANHCTTVLSINVNE